MTKSIRRIQNGNFQLMEVNGLRVGNDIAILASKCAECDTYRQVDYGRVEEVLSSNGESVDEFAIRPFRAKEQGGLAKELNRYTPSQLRGAWVVPCSNAADIVLPSMMREGQNPCIHDTPVPSLLMGELTEGVEIAVVHVACGNHQTYVVTAQGTIRSRRNNFRGDLDTLSVGEWDDVTWEELLNPNTNVIPLARLRELLDNQGECTCP